MWLNIFVGIEKIEPEKMCWVYVWKIVSSFRGSFFASIFAGSIYYNIRLQSRYKMQSTLYTVSRANEML